MSASSSSSISHSFKSPTSFSGASQPPPDAKRRAAHAEFQPCLLDASEMLSALRLLRTQQPATGPQVPLIGKVRGVGSSASSSRSPGPVDVAAGNAERKSSASDDLHAAALRAMVRAFVAVSNAEQRQEAIDELSKDGQDSSAELITAIRREAALRAPCTTPKGFVELFTRCAGKFEASRDDLRELVTRQLSAPRSLLGSKNETSDGKAASADFARWQEDMHLKGIEPDPSLYTNTRLFHEKVILAVDKELHTCPLEDQFRMIDALAYSFSTEKEWSFRAAASALQGAILSRPEPVRTLLICAYVQGMGGDPKAMEKSWVMAATTPDTPLSERRAQLQSVRTGLRLASNPLAAYESQSSVPAEHRLKIAHWVTASRMRDLDLAGPALDAIFTNGPDAAPGFHKAAIATQVVCQRRPAIDPAEVALLRTQLVGYAVGDIQKAPLSRTEALVGCGVVELLGVNDPRISSKGDRAHMGPRLSSADAMLGQMLRFTYSRMAAQALAAATEAEQRIPRDPTAADHLEAAAAFLANEKQALGAAGIPPDMAAAGIAKKLDATIQELRVRAEQIRSGRATTREGTRVTLPAGSAEPMAMIETKGSSSSSSSSISSSTSSTSSSSSSGDAGIKK